MLRFDKLSDIPNNQSSKDSVVLQIVRNESFRTFSGKDEYGNYHIKINKDKLDHWQYAVCDFILYNETLKKVPIIIASIDVLNQALVKKDECQATKALIRQYEPQVLVHSTTLSNWESIRNDGYLYSWASLKQSGKIREEYPIGQLLGDPLDYSNYIMLGTGQSLSGEYVVMSKQAGQIKCKDHDEYQPGVRLYFDANKLAKDGKLIRDGIHLKVKENIKLTDYLIESVDVSKIEKLETYTPSSFSIESNRYFECIQPNYKL